jgi:hypothetical protein
MWGNLAEAFVALAMIAILPAAVGAVAVVVWLVSRTARSRARRPR